jgi:hypothetical protein
MRVASLPPSPLPFLGIACRTPNTRGGLWFGSPERFPRVRVTGFFADGGVASAAGAVLLHPGFG